MEWIKITDEVPEKEVIAIGFQQEIIIGYISGDEMVGYECENDHELLEKITHWMSLPEPPNND